MYTARNHRTLTALVLAATAFGVAAGSVHASQWRTAYVRRGPKGTYDLSTNNPSLVGGTIRERTPIDFTGTQYQVFVNGETVNGINISKLTLAPGLDANGALTGPPVPITFSGSSSVMVNATDNIAGDIIAGNINAGTYYLQTTFQNSVVPLFDNVDNTYYAAGDHHSDTTLKSYFSKVALGNAFRVDVLTTDNRPLILCYGDSLTQGYLSSANSSHDYPSQVGQQLGLPTLNLGKRGDFETTQPGYAGPLAGSLKGVDCVVFMMGVNDLIRHLVTNLPTYQTAAKQIIADFHAQGLKIYWCTVTPYKGFVATDSTYYTAEGLRQQINTWIRTSIVSSAGADGMIDTDEAVRDPNDPAELIPSFSVDGVHMTDAGYGAMANQVSMFLRPKLIPTVAITSPLPGIVGEGTQTVNLTASVTPGIAPIAKVDYFNGTTLIGTATTAPYTLAWPGVGYGNYTIIARATDTRSVAGKSLPVSITVYPVVKPTNLIVTPSQFTQGTTTTGIVSLNALAPTQGQVVILSSGDATVTVPTSVTVPAGASSVAFPISSSATTLPGDPAHPGPVTIGASVNGAKISAPVTVLPEMPAAVVSSVKNIPSGTSFQIRVYVNHPAPSVGLSVSLLSSNAIVTVPSTVTIPAGQTVAIVNCTAGTVMTDTPSVIRASANDVHAATTVTVVPTSANVPTLSPYYAKVQDPTFTLKLSGSGFASDSVVNWNGVALATTYTSSTRISATVPSTTLTTAGDVTITVTSASANTTSSPQIFPVYNPSPTINILSPSYALAGSSDTTVTITGSGLAPTTTVLFDGNYITSANVSGTQETCTVPAKSLVTSGFHLIQMQTPGPNGGLSYDLPFTVASSVYSVTSAAPTMFVGGGSDSPITLTGAGFTTGYVDFAGVSLNSTGTANTETASVPAWILNRPGVVPVDLTVGGNSVETSAPYSASIVSPAAIVTNLTPGLVFNGSADTQLVINGTNFFAGSTVLVGGHLMPAVVNSPTQITLTVPAAMLTKSGPLSIVVANPLPSVGLSLVTYLVVLDPTTTIFLNHGSVTGGQSVTGTVVLNFAAPAAGLTVELKSDTPAALQVPATIVVPAGATTATFPVTTSPVAANTLVTVLAKAGSAAIVRSTTLTVNAPLPSGVKTEGPVKGGSKTKLAFYVSGAAPAGGITMNISSSDPSVPLPSTITVLAGTTNTVIEITTAPVTVSTTATITETLGATSASNTLVVTP